MDIEILKNIILSVILGFLIGLERNISFKTENEKGFAGSRTFAIIFAVIYGLVHFIGNKYGNIGIYFVSFISGIVDVDAITLSLSSLNIPIKTAFIGISIASISNSIFKLSLVLIFGKKQLFKLILNFFLIILTLFTILVFISLALL